MALDWAIEGDGEQRRSRADQRLAPPIGMEFEIGLGEDALPAMLVELVDRRRGAPDVSSREVCV